MSEPTYQDKIVSETNEELGREDVEATPEQLLKTINFMIKQMQGLVEGHSAERAALVRSLAKEQKEVDRLRKILTTSTRAKAKIFVKKILIGMGWYEPSSQELQLIFEQDHGAMK
jgi:hypothetical protein